MTNIIQILHCADEKSVVLLDELGTGTDPAEGMGLAIAILEELAAKNCLFVATTHYPEVKAFAQSTRGLVNARMAFDRQSLLPLYRLEIGEAGESCALFIAKRLGLPQRMIDRAARAAYRDAADASAHTDQAFVSQAGTPVVNESSNGIREIEFVSQKIPQQEKNKTPVIPRSMRFNIGDSVMVYPQKLIAIVYQKANEKGEVGIQLKGRKQLINHKRLKPHVPAGELYPDNYDFSIIFDSVAHRKIRHTMEKKHDPHLVIETTQDERSPSR